MPDERIDIVIVAVTLAGDQVGRGLGRADTVAIATVENGEITSWSPHEVGWDAAHDAEGEGAHHARIVRFTRDHGVSVFIAGGAGAGMRSTMDKLGVTLVTTSGDARAAALAAAAG